MMFGAVKMTRAAARSPRHTSVSTQFLGKHSDRDSNSRMLQIKQKISAIDKVDIGIVCVSPSRGPRLRNFKIVAAVSKSRPPFHDLDMTDREVVVPAKMRAEMFVCYAPVFLVLFLIMLLFLSSIFIVSMLVLGKRGNHSRKKHSRANRSQCCESFHVKPLRS
jgi:hypothetical protein